jgi:hypothetical protein
MIFMCGNVIMKPLTVYNLKLCRAGVESRVEEAYEDIRQDASQLIFLSC